MYFFCTEPMHDTGCIAVYSICSNCLFLAHFSTPSTELEVLVSV